MEHTIAEPISLGGSEHVASFDELEAVHAAPALKEKAGDKPIEVTKETTSKKEKDESEKSAKSEKTSSKEKEVKESKSDKTDKDTKELKTDKPVPLEKEGQVVKTYKLKNGDTELDVSSDSLVPVKINGKTEQVKFQDVLNGYSGQAHLDRQYKAFKTEQTEFKKQSELADEAVKTLYDLAVGKKDLRGFIEYLAGAYGADAKELYDGMIGQIETQIEQLAQLSPEERKAKKIQDELEYYRTREATAKTRAQEMKEKQTLETQVEQVMQKASMDKETFVKRYDELVALGSVKAEDITPEYVASYHKNMTTIETVESAINTHAPELENKEAELEKLSTYAIQLGASKEEIEEIVKQLYSNQAERKLTKKIEKSERKSRAEIPVRDPQNDPVWFSELE